MMIEEQISLSSPSVVEKYSGDFLVSKFHKPLVGIVVPNFNYAEFLQDALKSVQEQTYRNFKCIVVDDCSKTEDYSLAKKTVTNLKDDRFRIVRNKKNSGMVHSIFNGIEEINCAFLCVLDPDDRYVPHFLERMLDLHLRSSIFCPVACCDQFLLQIGGGMVTGSQYSHGSAIFNPNHVNWEHENFLRHGFHNFYRHTQNGWHWSTTSSMMFRTDALKLIKPTRKLDYSGQGDSYCANGAHMMGGSILLNEPLIYRGLHKRNDFISSEIFSIYRPQAKADAQMLSEVVKLDVIEAFFANGSYHAFDDGYLREMIYNQFPKEMLAAVIDRVPIIQKLLQHEDMDSLKSSPRPKKTKNKPI